MNDTTQILKKSQDSLAQAITQQVTSSLSWDEVDKFENAPREGFDLDCLPSAISDYAKAVAHSMSVSEDMVGACALAALSVACQPYSVEVKVGWEEPLNLYAAIVAGAGEKKSPVLKAFTKVFDDFSADYNFAHADEFAASRQREKNLRKKLAKAEADLAKGESDAEEESIRLAQELANFKPAYPMRFYTSDCTSEKLPRLMMEQSGQLSIISAEGGIISTIAGRYSGEPNTDIFCKAFYGESVQVDRVGRESEHLSRPILSILLCIQPVVLQKLTGNRELAGVGLVDRFLFCAPESSIGRGVFNNPPVPDKALCAYRNKMWDLLEKRDTPKTLQFSTEARKLFADFYDHFQQFTIPSDFEGIEGWASKHCGIVARIAAILQLAEDGDTTISVDSVARAIKLSDYFQEQAQRVLRGIVLDGITANAMYILGKLRRIVNSATPDGQGQYKVSFRDLMRKCRRESLRTKKDYTAPLQILINRGYVQINENTEIEQISHLWVNPEVGAGGGD